MNVGQAERIAGAVLGAGLMVAGARRGGLSGIALTLLGGTLSYRGLSGHCPGYAMLGIEGDDATRYSHPLNRRIHARGSITIARPLEDVFSLCCDPERLAQVLPQLRMAHGGDGTSSRWSCVIAGRAMQFDTEILEQTPEGRIAWRCGPASDLPHEGRVDLREAPAEMGTEVRVEIICQMPGGAAGAAMAMVMQYAPGQELRSALRAFKQYLETGEVATSATSFSVSAAELQKRAAQRPRQVDAVQEASEESFPASDAPAWTAASRP